MALYPDRIMHTVVTLKPNMFATASFVIRNRKTTKKN